MGLENAVQLLRIAEWTGPPYAARVNQTASLDWPAAGGGLVVLQRGRGRMKTESLGGLDAFEPAAAAAIAGVFTDLDDTLTTAGRMTAGSLAA